MKYAIPALAALLIAGCARSSTVPLSADTIQITSSAAPACGRTGAQSVASRRAAIETLNRGFDKFAIVGGEYQNNVGVVGHTPVYANTYGTAQATARGNMVYASGQSTTTYSGGRPIIAGSHDQGVTVKMFKADDPAGANAVDARGQLGPKWKDALGEGQTGICG
jgi:hypothetical protein